MTAAAPRTALTLFRDGKRPRPAAPSRGSCHGSCRSPQGYSAFSGCAVSGGGLQNRRVYDSEATRGAGQREHPPLQFLRSFRFRARRDPFVPDASVRVGAAVSRVWLCTHGVPGHVLVVVCQFPCARQRL